MTDEYVLQQEFGDGVDHPVHRLEYCREAIKAEFEQRVRDEIDGPDVVTIDIRDDDGFVLVKHTLEADADDHALRDAIRMTDCEIEASAGAYRDQLGATEELLCGVPTEWADDDRFDRDEIVAQWKRGDHITTVRPTKAEAKRELRMPLLQLVGGVILYAVLWYYYFGSLASVQDPTVYQAIAKDVVYVGLYVNPVFVLGYAVVVVYPAVKAYRNARPV